MQQVSLAAEHRTVVRRQLGALRRSGYIPAVLYGADKTPTNLQLPTRESSKIINRIFGTVLIDLSVAGQPHNVLIREIQRNFVTDEILHVDFYEVDMNRPMRVTIPVRLIGTAPAVTIYGGVLVRGLANIEIECLPSKLIQEIDIDLSVLKQINDNLHARDLPMPEGVRLITDGDEQIARVTYASQEEIATDKPETAGEVAVVEKGKKEEEE